MSQIDGIAPPTLRRIQANGIEINVATAGAGPAILLLHGWPHTWRLWHAVMTDLSRDHLVIAPDLRGLGGSSRAADGYDLRTLARDEVALLDALHVEQAGVVGIDLGVQIATMLALDAPSRVGHLVLMEGLVGNLPGAEPFLARGVPWWFGFHAIPGFAESVLEGHAERYIGWFLANGTMAGNTVDPAVQNAFLEAYSDRESLRCGFEHYRAFPKGREQLTEALARGPIANPTLAVAGGVIGAATAGQLTPICERLTKIEIDGCGHLVPLEQPVALSAAIRDFVG